MLFTHFYHLQGKKYKPGLYLQQAGTLPLNPKLFCQQIDQKNTLWWNELPNMFFHRCRYKCCFRFCAFGFEATPHLSCYLISFADKRHHGQLLLLFLCNVCTFFSSVGGVLVINLFPLLLIDGYILAIQQIITHKGHLWYSFWSVAIFRTASEALGPWS